MIKIFSIHWILKGKRIYLSKNSLNALPSVGHEIRQSDKTFYRVKRIVWCLDERDDLGQRVNIEIEKIKL